MSKPKPKLWDEFTIIVHNDKLDIDVPICGLCGNTGIVDTTASAICMKKLVGIKHYCICPNGRSRKRRKR